MFSSVDILIVLLFEGKGTYLKDNPSQKIPSHQNFLPNLSWILLK